MTRIASEVNATFSGDTGSMVPRSGLRGPSVDSRSVTAWGIRCIEDCADGEVRTARALIYMSGIPSTITDECHIESHSIGPSAGRYERVAPVVESGTPTPGRWSKWLVKMLTTATRIFEFR